MKQYLHFFFFLLCTNVFAQNIPSVTVKDSENLKLTDLKVTVDIIGNLAVTTYDMKFYNGLNRTLEGELVFPLGEGQTVSGFAMDVNGKLRDAVIVEKELGRVAYETTIRRKIDPGLLEKTEGNNYKARVYPIFPKNYKHIVLKFEQELSTLDGKQTYELPLGISQKLDQFSIAINVFNEQQPIVSKANYKDFFFQKKGKAYIAIISKENHAPTKPIVVQIPNNFNQENLNTFNGYFHYYKVLQPASRLKKKPKKVTIFWDASYSMRHRNLENELRVLKDYLGYLRDVKVNFIAFNNAIQTQKEFTIKNGDASNLLTEIQNVHYDGGTKLNLFQDVKTKADEILLFSDGLGNLGKFATAEKTPVYTINSLVSSNHQNLIDIATQSGGSYINLLRLDFPKAVQLLKEETYQFLGVKHGKSVREVYPKQQTNVYQDFAISGQFTEDTTIQLLFGYGGNVTEKIPVKIKKTEGTKEVKRLWAKQKLKDLYRAKEENKDKIISLATLYGLITDYTSMIILDRIEDYVRYKIEPPLELLEEYKRRLQLTKNAEKQREERLSSRRKNLLNDYKNLLNWYERDFEPKLPKQTKITTIKPVVINTPTRNNTGSVSGTITDDLGLPLPGATVIVKGTNRGKTTDFDGNFTINANSDETLVVSYVGFESREIRAVNTSINVQLEAGAQLEAVTLTAYGGAVNSSKVSSAITTVNSENIEEVTESSIDQVLQGSAAGLQIGTGSEQPGSIDAIVIRGQTSLNGNAQQLFVIDGKLVDQNAFRRLQQDDIESLGVLKNEQATALYGSRAAGGVVVVTTKNGITENEDTIEAFNEKVADKITLKTWNSDMPYINVLEKETTVAEAYKKYLEIRVEYANIPTFYLDVADFFHSRKATNIAVTVITNLMEIELHNHELLKAAAYKLEYFERYEMAVLAYEKVLEIRPEEPQSYRDLALAYEHVGEVQKSYDLLYKLYDGQLLQKDENGRFTGIERIAFVELSRLVSMHGNKLYLTEEAKKLFQKMPVDVRIVIDWNHNDTDIDLWVVDPTGEKAYYSHKDTKIGGKMSDDLTQGYGPEEFMLKDAIDGEYNIFINHFSDRVQKISGPTILKVTLYTNYGTENEKKKITIVRLAKVKGKLEVGSLFFGE
ncbi:TonB-dependent receptor SusC [Kordia antarctica]|uniref:TonB-dependent receptor SusC n=1 Tax=Kordia antarctica TaxID=1218801 RepID=A0A7L4ZJG4_9FLAO|nr:VIT domain-containing protein [Kordia antarctica]QHI36772.1 TonB-dependent receptor SusC [Kordia antarctica]